MAVGLLTSLKRKRSQFTQIGQGILDRARGNRTFGNIDQAIYDRRVSLLEARWSENV